MTKREKLQEWREGQFELLAQANERELEVIGGHEEAKKRIQQNYQEQLSELRRKKRDEDLSHYQSFFGHMASALRAGGAKMLKISKAFALAEASVSIARGAAKALELPFPANLAAFAKVIATGAKAISSINSASPGKASIGGSSSGGESAASSSTQPREPQRTVRIEVEGEGMFADMLRENVDQIADAIIGNTKQGGAPILVGR